MTPIIHFLASIVAGIGIGLHYKRKYSLILLLAFIALFPDLDHFIPTMGQGIKAFHNVYVFFTLPLIIFLICYLYELTRKEGSTKYQRIGLVFFVMLVGHMFLDGIEGGAMTLYFPLSTEQFVLSDISFSPHPYFALSSAQTLLIIWGAIILATNLIETRIYNRHEGYYENIFKYLEVSRPRLWAMKLKAVILRAFGRSSRIGAVSDASDAAFGDLEREDLSSG